MPTEGRVYQDGLDLVFSPTEEGDSGAYTCVAQNKAGRRTQEVTFTVASESLLHFHTITNVCTKVRMLSDGEGPARRRHVPIKQDVIMGQTDMLELEPYL